MGELVKIAAFATLLEAEQIQSILAEQGVVAFVEGGSSDPSLVYVSSIRGGIRLVVPHAELDRARQVLAELNSLPATEAWFCGACEVDVDAGFVVCWSCGKPQDAVAVERPVSAPAKALDESAELSRNSERSFDASNPYASSIATRNQPKDALPVVDEQVDAILQRAYRAAWIGVVSIFVLNMYSAYLLIKASVLAESFSPDGRKWFYRSIMINLASAILLAFAVRYAFI